MTQDITTTVPTIKAGRLLTLKAENYIVDTLTRAINIPFMNHAHEKVIFKHGIILVEKVLSEHLPKEWIKYLHNHSKGLDEKALRIFENRALKIIESIITIPFVPEYIEALILKTILNIFLNSLKDGSAVAPKKHL